VKWTGSTIEVFSVAKKDRWTTRGESQPIAPNTGGTEASEAMRFMRAVRGQVEGRTIDTGNGRISTSLPLRRPNGGGRAIPRAIRYVDRGGKLIGAKVERTPWPLSGIPVHPYRN